MPIVKTVMQNSMKLKASSYKIAGSKLNDILAAVSAATCQYILSASMINSTNVALGPGSGTQTGIIQNLVAKNMSSLMALKANSTQLSGKELRHLCDSVAFGVVTAMKSAMLQGTIIGAGPGTGNGKVSGLVPKALENLIYQQQLFRVISGRDIRKLISAFSVGICNHIMSSGSVLVTNIGVAASPPAGPVSIPMAPGMGKFV